MTHPTDRLLIAESYLLPKETYRDLCHIREKLLFMTQLAGTSHSNGEEDTMIFIRRGLIGELFRDMSYQLGDVLETIAETAPIMQST
jgi:hypothetical protein